MNREQARNIIVNTFEKPFNKDNYICFLQNLHLLKSFEQSSFSYQGNYIPDAFAPYITSLERVGKYTYDDKEIDLLIVQLKKETSLVRARTMQRNFIAWYLKGSRGGKLKEAALVAFVAPGLDDWRFSLVKMDYRIVETSSGRIAPKEEFTPARRWSFLVGANEKSHTAQSRFLPILENDKSKPTLEDLEQVFNVEVVTQEFFEKYRDLFIRTKLALDQIVIQASGLNDLHKRDACDTASGLRPQFYKRDAHTTEFHKRDAGGTASRLWKEFQAKNINTVDFAKKLLGQIVFLYFLQKKGWFGVAKGKPWGSGPKDFMRRLFNKEFGDYHNFYNDILEPLFYEALRTDRSSADHYYSRFNCKIPFLNGGLFDPINDFDWVNVDICLPNELFSNTNRTREGDIGDGILDIFDRYNFTVNEEEPLDKEVALDPELLGKIYEKLNAIRPDNFDEYVAVLQSGRKGEETKFNKEFGVYYTPREIVHYMCQESLIHYLQTELQGKAIHADIEKFVKLADAVQEIEAVTLEKEARIKSGAQKSTKYESQIPESIRQNAHLIDTLLAEIKVCDPAVGSGAFPIGMMHEIVKLRRLLSLYIAQACKVAQASSPVVPEESPPVFSEASGEAQEFSEAQASSVSQASSPVESETSPPVAQASPFGIQADSPSIEKALPPSTYDLKRHCIENSLYGVDIDPGAVEICKLRFWLSMIVDEEDFYTIKPLPNLDYKVVCGDSLLGFPENWGSPIEKEIENLMDKYFSETNPVQKQKLKNQIDEKINWRLEQSEKSFGYKINFDFKLFFPKVFREKGGFDIVIENPPYVRQERIKNYKPFLQSAKYEVFNSTSDLYTYFYEKSYKIAKPEGFICLISSNKWMRTQYGEKLRGFLKEKTSLKQIIDFNGYPVFEATVDTNIILFQKSYPDNDSMFNAITVGEGFSVENISEYIKENSIKMKQLGLNKRVFILAEDKILKLKEKIERIGKPLKDWDVKIYRGILTGFNEAFIITTEKRNEILSRCKDKTERKLTEEIIKPILRGRDIGRYYYRWAGLWLIATFPALKLDINDYPALKKYFLANFNIKQLEQSGKKYPELGFNARKKTNNKWFETQDNIAYYPEFEKEKIVWQRVTQKFSFCLVPKGLYILDSMAFLISKNNKYILALLNSKLVNLYIKTYVHQYADTGFLLSNQYVERIFIPTITLSEQKSFIELVDKILKITKDGDFSSNPQKQEKVKELEREIDRLVYKLYDLTEDEIKIIENEA